MEPPHMLVVLVHAMKLLPAHVTSYINMLEMDIHVA